MCFFGAAYISQIYSSINNKNVGVVPLTTTQQWDKLDLVTQSHNNATKIRPHGGRTVGTTLNVPFALWKRLRNHATDVQMSQQQIWIDALSEYLDERKAA